MQAIQWILQGNWGHFKKPETNNNPLTHEIIPKTSLVGLIGAVIGKERQQMKPLFPQLCEDFLYGVEIRNTIRKVSYGFTIRRAVDPMYSTRKAFEILKNPCYLITLALKEERSKEIWDAFKFSLENNEAHYPPVLGLHNCPANIEFIGKGSVSPKQGKFLAKCFVSRKDHKISFDKSVGRIGFDRIPTWQNEDFWNPPDRYTEVIYSYEGKTLEVEGFYYQHENGEQWWLV